VAEARVRTRDESERTALPDSFIRGARFRLLAFFIGEQSIASPRALLPVPCYFLTVNCARLFAAGSHQGAAAFGPPTNPTQSSFVMQTLLGSFT
jgi:hypothetical protein